MVHLGCFTCDFMLPELVVLEGLLHWPDGCVVDVQKLLHGSWTEGQSHSQDGGRTPSHQDGGFGVNGKRPRGVYF